MNNNKYTKLVIMEIYNIPFEDEIDINDLDTHLNSVKNNIREAYVALNNTYPGVTNVKIELKLDYGNPYDDKERMQFRLYGARPMTEAEIIETDRKDAQNAINRHELEKKQYEELKKKFEK